jgi:hypothetical protein
MPIGEITGHYGATADEQKRRQFREFGEGRTYARTKRKFGKKRADKQRVAAVLSARRKHKRSKKRSTSRSK